MGCPTGRSPKRFLSTPSARRATGCPRLPFRGPRISIHALREEGDEVCLLGVAVGRDFYPRPPRGGRREDVRVSRQSRGISIHALREEGDYTESRGRSGAAYFYPRPPRGGRRAQAHREGPRGTISIHALREEGDQGPGALHGVLRISIHALREEGDACSAVMPYTIINFYPRPPRGGRPVSVPVRYSSFLNFYPRPPRGGRRGMRRGSPDLRNFYPRPPRGGRRRQPVQWPRRFSISIHALREEGDLPLGRNETARKISIHALREEGDVQHRHDHAGQHNFYPRPPRGGRRAGSVRGMAVNLFLSTPSARRATPRFLHQAR